MIRTILLITAIIILIINIILTILEAAHYYHEAFHPGRIRGESGANDNRGPAGRVKICGMWYNVYWVIRGREGVISLEDREEMK